MSDELAKRLFREQPQASSHPWFGWWDCVWLAGRLRDRSWPYNRAVVLLDEMKCESGVQ